MSDKNVLAVVFAAACLALAGCEGGQEDEYAANEQQTDEQREDGLEPDAGLAEDSAVQDQDQTDARVAEGAGTGRDTGMGQDGLGMGDEGEHTVAGTVTAIDEQANEVTIDHEPVESLNWPAMVMPFQVSDASLLEDVEVGERVTVTLAERGDGQYVIQDLEPAGLQR